MNTLSPIVLFCYNRPNHVKQTLEALSKNDLANESVLYIYCDGAKEGVSAEQIDRIAQTRRTVKEKLWCKEVFITERDNNIGLADSIVAGVTEIVNRYGSVIVLEDDIVTSKGFLRYMNDALNLYADEELVMQVSGFIYPLNKTDLPDTFFYNVNSCWGWGTWSRAWKNYNNNALDLYNLLIKSGVSWDSFNGFQSNAFHDQLIANIENRLKTWAVKWHASMFLCAGKVLHPKQTLTRNIGFDGSGENCGNDDKISQIVLSDYVEVKKLNINTKSESADNALRSYFKSPSNVQKRRSFMSKVLLAIASRV